jgi:hypothetical protein
MYVISGIIIIIVLIIIIIAQLPLTLGATTSQWVWANAKTNNCSYQYSINSVNDGTDISDISGGALPLSCGLFSEGVTESKLVYQFGTGMLYALQSSNITRIVRLIKLQYDTRTEIGRLTWTTSYSQWKWIRSAPSIANDSFVSLAMSPLPTLFRLRYPTTSVSSSSSKPVELAQIPTLTAVGEGLVTDNTTTLFFIGLSSSYSSKTCLFVYNIGSSSIAATIPLATQSPHVTSLLWHSSYGVVVVRADGIFSLSLNDGTTSLIDDGSSYATSSSIMPQVWAAMTDQARDDFYITAIIATGQYDTSGQGSISSTALWQMNPSPSSISFTDTVQTIFGNDSIIPFDPLNNLIG